MRIALAQFNPVVGDIAGNTQKILALAHQAIAQGADILVTPELALTGYSPEDLLLRDGFYADCRRELEALAAKLTGITSTASCWALSRGIRRWQVFLTLPTLAEVA